MKLNYSESSLVIVGGWNPNVMNPLWIEQYLREPSPFGNQNKVNLNIHKDGTSVSIDGISISLAGNRLQFCLDIGNDLDLIEKYALKICKVLPNTLVNGYGANFHFYDNNLNPSIENVINTEILGDLNSQLSSKQCTLTFNLNDMAMTITYTISNSDNISGIAFNFHFNIGRLSEVESSLSKHSLTSLKDRATQILSDVYGLEVEV